MINLFPLTVLFYDRFGFFFGLFYGPSDESFNVLFDERTCKIEKMVRSIGNAPGGNPPTPKSDFMNKKRG